MEEIRAEMIGPKVAFRRKIHVRLDDEMHQKLRVRVAELGTTVQQYIEDLLKQSLGETTAPQA
jgi:predicted HicB family RNase H-like nuclease